MYCCVRCGRTKKQHMEGEVGACSQYDEGGRAFPCRAKKCIHPINCTRRQECLSIVTDYSKLPFRVDATIQPNSIQFVDKDNNVVGEIKDIDMSDSGRQVGDDMATGRPDQASKPLGTYGTESFGDKGRTRHGSPLFYALLDKMAETHDKKSHDYASNDNPFGNYHFAGMLSKLFDNPNDAGFVGRLGEKFYRLANLENNKKEVAVKDEGVEDTETDICVITLLWMVDRRNRRNKK